MFQNIKRFVIKKFSQILIFLFLLCGVTILFYYESFEGRISSLHDERYIKVESDIIRMWREKHRHVFTDQPKPNSNFSILEQAEYHTNIAGKFFEEYNKRKHYEQHKTNIKGVKMCSKVRLTDPAFLHFNNEYYQVLHYNQTEALYLYSAFYDNRFEEHKLRIFFTSAHQEATSEQSWKCLIWFDDIPHPILTDGYATNLWPKVWSFGAKDGVYGPMVMNCDIPRIIFEDLGSVARAVSIQTDGDCSTMEVKPTNILRIENHTKKTKGTPFSVGICHKSYHYAEKDMSVRLIEWLELLKIFQADNVYIYSHGQTDKMKAILDYYSLDGFLEWRHVHFPGEQVNIDLLYNYFIDHVGATMWPQEVLELNDCLYRNMAKHDYIGVFDLDEMIVPVKDKNYKDLIKRLVSLAEKGYESEEDSENDYLVYDGKDIQDMIKENIKNRGKKTYNKFDYIVNRHCFALEEKVEEFYLYNWDNHSTIASSQNETIPDYLFTMKHIHRSGFKDRGSNVKSFFDTQTVMSVHNHHATSCWNEKEYQSCRSIVADPAVHSRMFHFRHNRHRKPNAVCNSETPEACIYKDRTLWKFYTPLKKAVQQRLQLFL